MSKSKPELSGPPDEPSDNPSPDPADLDKWTHYYVFKYFKEKAYIL